MGGDTTGETDIGPEGSGGMSTGSPTGACDAGGASCGGGEVSAAAGDWERLWV